MIATLLRLLLAWLIVGGLYSALFVVFYGLFLAFQQMFITGRGLWREYRELTRLDQSGGDR